MDCIPHAADDLKTKAPGGLRWLDGLIAGRDYIAGDRFSPADIALLPAMDFVKDVGQPLDLDSCSVFAWFDRINARASVQARIQSSAAALHWTDSIPGPGMHA